MIGYRVLDGLIRFVAVTAFASAVASDAHGSQAGSSGKTHFSYRVVAITVKAFDTRTGEFVADLSDRSWNQINLELLATVELAWASGSPSAGRSVGITVAKGKQVVISRKVQPAVDEASPNYFIPVWIQGPFCEDLTIQARVIGQRESRKERRLEFRCGE